MTDTHDDLEKIMRRGGRPTRRMQRGGRPMRRMQTGGHPHIAQHYSNHVHGIPGGGSTNPGGSHGHEILSSGDHTHIGRSRRATMRRGGRPVGRPAMRRGGRPTMRGRMRLGGRTNRTIGRGNMGLNVGTGPYGTGVYRHGGRPHHIMDQNCSTGRKRMNAFGEDVCD